MITGTCNIGIVSQTGWGLTNISSQALLHRRLVRHWLPTSAHHAQQLQQGKNYLEGWWNSVRNLVSTINTVRRLHSFCQQNWMFLCFLSSNRLCVFGNIATCCCPDRMERNWWRDCWLFLFQRKTNRYRDLFVDMVLGHFQWIVCSAGLSVPALQTIPKSQ